MDQTDQVTATTTTTKPAGAESLTAPVELIARLYGMPAAVAARVGAEQAFEAGAIVERLDAWIDGLARQIDGPDGLAAARARVVLNLPLAWRACPTVMPADAGGAGTSHEAPPALFIALLERTTPAMTPPPSPRPMSPANFGPTLVTTTIARVRRATRRRRKEPWA